MDRNIRAVPYKDCGSSYDEGWLDDICTENRSWDDIKAVTAAVNHSGDSDSTGAVTGNILGAYLGFNAISERYVRPLELRKVIDEIAMDLFEDCPIMEYSSNQDEKWVSKYITCEYGKNLD